MQHPSELNARSAESNTGSTDLLRHEDLLALIDITRSLASEVHLTRLLHRILEEATKLTDSHDGSVILHDETRNRLYFADAVGDDAQMLLKKWGKTSSHGIPLVGSKAGQVFTSHMSQVVDAVANDPNHFKGVDNDTRRQTTSMVCVPLIVTSKRSGQVRALGVIQILNKKNGNYTKRDRVLLERFADQAAVALENAQLVSDLFAHMGLYATPDLDPLEAYRDLRKV